MRFLFAIALATSAVCTNCLGDVVIDTYPAATDAQFAIRSNWPGPETDQQFAAGFTLPAKTRITQLTWSGYYFGAEPLSSSLVDFTVRLHVGDGIPNALPVFDTTLQLAHTQTGKIADFGRYPIYRFSLPISDDISFNNDMQLWLSVLDSDPKTTVDFRWMFSLRPTHPISAYRYIEAGDWDATTSSFAFAVEGVAIPEPSTLALLAIGCAAIGCRRRR